MASPNKPTKQSMALAKQIAAQIEPTLDTAIRHSKFKLQTEL